LEQELSDFRIFAGPLATESAQTAASLTHPDLIGLLVIEKAFPPGRLPFAFRD